MNSIVIYFVLIITIMIGFALIIYFTYNQGWPDSILNELIKPQKKDKDKIEEQAIKDKFGIRAIYPPANTSDRLTIIEKQFSAMQSQIHSLLSSLGSIQDQNQVNQMAKTLYDSKILNITKTDNTK
jgi:hypothetical protein